jgi:hypothetical protein
MPKLILFNQVGFINTAKEFRSNDPDLVLNGDDFQANSAIVASGDWTLFPDVNFQGTPISLGANGGPDADGSYKDPADWSGAGAFHVKSIQHN